MRLIIFATVFAFFVTCANSTDYEWGKLNPDDYLIADDKVSKRNWLFGIPEAEYVFTQKKGDRLTISAIKISDPRGKCKAAVTLIKGGIGKKTATLRFVGDHSKKFRCKVKIWGYE